MKSSIFYYFKLVVSIVIFYISGCNFKHSDQIVYINTPKLLAEYQGMKDAMKKLESKTKEWQSNIDTLGKEIERDLHKYEKERSTLSAKEIKLTEQLLQNRQQTFVQYQQSMEKKAAEESQRLKQEALNVVNEFMKEYGKKNNYRFILGATQAGNIIYAEESSDITDEVVKQLNAKYKK